MTKAETFSKSHVKRRDWALTLKFWLVSPSPSTCITLSSSTSIKSSSHLVPYNCCSSASHWIRSSSFHQATLLVRTPSTLHDVRPSRNEAGVNWKPWILRAIRSPAWAMRTQRHTSYVWYVWYFPLLIPSAQYHPGMNKIRSRYLNVGLPMHLLPS